MRNLRFFFWCAVLLVVPLGGAKLTRSLWENGEPVLAAVVLISTLWLGVKATNKVTE